MGLLLLLASSAAAVRKDLLKPSDFPFEHEHIRIDAQNNLGYMHFTGWGIAKDGKPALRYCRYACRVGHAESAYHLCHYLGEPKDPEFRRSVAVGYCKEALHQYEQRGELDENALHDNGSADRQCNGPSLSKPQSMEYLECWKYDAPPRLLISTRFEG